LFNATISYIAPSIDATTHRLPVRGGGRKSDGRALKPEDVREVSVSSRGPGAAAAAVPDSAVVHEGSTAHVWVADLRDKAIALRQVRTGRSANGMVEVTEGLKAG